MQCYFFIAFGYYLTFGASFILQIVMKYMNTGITEKGAALMLDF